MFATLLYFIMHEFKGFNSRYEHQRANSTFGFNRSLTGSCKFFLHFLWISLLKVHIYVLIFTYFWDEHLILWGTANFKNSTFVGIYGERGERIKNIMTQFFLCSTSSIILQKFKFISWSWLFNHSLKGSLGKTRRVIKKPLNSALHIDCMSMKN